MRKKPETASIFVPEAEQPYQIPDNWRWVNVGKVSALYRGVSYKKDDAHTLKEADDILILRGGNIGEGYIDTESDNVYVNSSLVCQHQIVCKYDIVIIGSTGSKTVIGRAGISLENYNDVAFGAFLLLVRPAEMVNPQYLDYYFLSDDYRNRMKKLSKGININNIRADYITQCPIPFPPLAEQQRIVDRIESLFAKLDEARDKAREVVDGFELRKAAILHRAFSGELVKVSSASMIPLSTIADEIHIGPFGSALHKDDYIPDGVPVINPKHIVNQSIVPDGKTSISNEKAMALSSYILRENDIILARRGKMGRSAPVTEKEDGWLCGTGSMIIRLKKGYDAALYSQIISSGKSVQYLEENAVGSTMSNLNEKIIRNLPVPNFSSHEQKRMLTQISSLLDGESQAMESAKQVIDHIDAMKKAILGRAFRGELGTNDPSEASPETLLRDLP